MRILLIALGIGLLLSAGAGACVDSRDAAGVAPADEEIVQLTSATRARLGALRAEAKFGPHDFPPLGYTGPDRPEDAPALNAAVNDFIDGLLAEPDGPISAREVASRMGPAMDRVRWLATADRDRTAGYLIEVWYILGFRGATGRFAHGDGYPVPLGYAEPLPPGWTAPDRPRLH